MRVDTAIIGIMLTLTAAGWAQAGPQCEDEPSAAGYRPAPVDLLAPYEAEPQTFAGAEIADHLVYFHQRKIGEALVQGDYKLYHFDKASRQLMRTRSHWREDLPKKLPPTITQAAAEKKVAGQIRFSGLYYLEDNSAVFPVTPTPANPCWAVEAATPTGVEVTVIDAVTGVVLGNGVPPPANAFSLTGPWDLQGCTGAWSEWYQNARDGFNSMGYPTDAIQWPGQDLVKAQVQSETVALFYELAHGGSFAFANACGDLTDSSEVSIWLGNYEPFPFVFLGSCDGMCDTSAWTLSNAFRKGASSRTTTVGYCGMSNSPCESACWNANYTIRWQTALFGYLNQGWTVKAAFDRANLDFPGCGLNNCMRFAGDPNLTLVPVISRVPCRQLTITAQPANTRAMVGGSASFTVTVSGTAPVTYQWRKGEANISGATSAVLTINPVTAADAGSYYVALSNPCSAPYSNAAVLTVLGNPPADLDVDSDVDLQDLERLVGCMGGPNVAPPKVCELTDLDGDHDVDQEDFAILQRCLSGSGVAADPACAG
jgi:hypothetical protein